MSWKDRRATALDGVPPAAGAAATGAGAGAAGAGAAGAAGAGRGAVAAGAAGAGTGAGAEVAGAGTSTGADVVATAAGDGVGAPAGADVDGAGAGVGSVGVAEGLAGAGDWALAVIQFHHPKGQEAASAGAEPAVSSPPARTRVITGAAICLLSFRTGRTVPTAHATLHIE
jgi:hypothetical protein